jgi:hypothetical protein
LFLGLFFIFLCFSICCVWFFVIASSTFHHCGVVFFFLALHLNLLSMNSLLLQPPLQVFSFPILWLSLGIFCFPSFLNLLCVVFYYCKSHAPSLLVCNIQVCNFWCFVSFAYWSIVCYCLLCCKSHIPLPWFELVIVTTSIVV